jgi:hypothetical protein
MSQERNRVCFYEDIVPKPLYNGRLEENLALRYVIFLINSAAGQLDLLIVHTELTELTIL